MVKLNLVPESLLAAEARRVRIGRWASAIALALAALALAAGLDWMNRARASDLRAQNDRHQTDLENMRAELGAVTIDASRVRLRIERAKALRNKRAWSGLFALISDSMPAGCWLTSLATDPAAPRGGLSRQRRLKSMTGRTSTSPAGGRSYTAGAPQSPQQQPTTVTIDAPRKLRIKGYAAEYAQTLEFEKRLTESSIFTHVIRGSSQRELILDVSCHSFELVCEW